MVGKPGITVRLLIPFEKHLRPDNLGDRLIDSVLSLGLDAFYHIYIQTNPFDEIQRLQWAPSLDLRERSDHSFLSRACERRIREIEDFTTTNCDGDSQKYRNL